MGFSGWSSGDDAFFLTGSMITFDPNGSTIIISKSIGDDSPSSFVGAPVGVTAGAAAGAALTIGTLPNPAGIVNLMGAGTYSGGVTLTKGTLGVGNNTSLGTATLNNPNSGNTLQSAAPGV